MGEPHLPSASGGGMRPKPDWRPAKQKPLRFQLQPSQVPLRGLISEGIVLLRRDSRSVLVTLEIALFGNVQCITNLRQLATISIEKCSFFGHIAWIKRGTLHTPKVLPWPKFDPRTHQELLE